MMITALPYPSQSFQSQPAVPARSPRTSLILAEAARQRRLQCHRQRKRRVRRMAWFAWFDRRPFDLVRTREMPEAVFSGSVPLVYALRFIS